MNQENHFKEKVCVCIGMNGNCTADQLRKESLDSKI